VSASLTVDEAAIRLGCSRRSIYRLLATKRLRSYKVGGLRRIGEDEIEQYRREAMEEEAKAS